MLVIVDYGAGNLTSIKNMFKKIGYGDVAISDDKSKIKAAEKLILPGVGHFDYGMRQLQASGLLDTLNKVVLEDKKPILGICLGAQLIAKIYGSKIYKNKNNFVEIGYRTLIKNDLKFFSNVSSMLQFHNEGIGFNPYMNVLAFGRIFEIDAFKIKSKKIYGFQFHPEKSQENGMVLLKNFLSGDYF